MSEIKRGYDNSHPAFKGVVIVASAPTVGVLTVAGGEAVATIAITKPIETIGFIEGLNGQPPISPNKGKQWIKGTVATLKKL